MKGVNPLNMSGDMHPPTELVYTEARWRRLPSALIEEEETAQKRGL